MGRAVFRKSGKWQMLFFDIRIKIAWAVSRHEDCSHIAGHVYLQYLRVFPFTYKSKTKFSRSANNVKFKNKLYVKFKVLRVCNL